VPDAGLPVRFGWFLVPDAADPKGLATEVRGQPAPAPPRRCWPRRPPPSTCCPGAVPLGAGAFLDGPAAQWVEQLLPLVTETGMDTFVLWPSESSARQLQLFADEVAPALREAVAAHRGRG
jgi:hypothetical protein